MGRPRALSGKGDRLRKEWRHTQQREWVRNRRKAAVASTPTGSSASDSLAKEHIARLESRRREQNQRCKGRRRANATDDDRAMEAKRKREARRRLHSTPAEQFPGAMARFRREFVENPFGVTCTVCDLLCSGSPAVGELPSYPEVIARTERITKRIQELLLSAREGRRECFLPCTENILQAGVFSPGCDRSLPKDRSQGGLGSFSSLRAATGFRASLDMGALFVRGGQGPLGAALRQLLESARRLQREGRANPETQQLIQCAYDVAKAAKHLVMAYPAPPQQATQDDPATQCPALGCSPDLWQGAVLPTAPAALRERAPAAAHATRVVCRGGRRLDADPPFLRFLPASRTVAKSGVGAVSLSERLAFRADVRRRPGPSGQFADTGNPQQGAHEVGIWSTPPCDAFARLTRTARTNDARRRPRTDQATAPQHASGQRGARPTTSPVVEGPRLAGRPPKARTMSSELEQTEAEMKGWLAKWTNYLKGYQKRWFVLSNGLLSYYRNQAEMAHTCRGTISLTFHLKASNEIERQKWVTALELAKARAVRMMESEEDEELDMPSQLDKSELLTVLRLLHVKLEDLSMCSDLIAKHGTALQRSLTDLEQLEGGPGPEVAARVRAVNERATLFRITSTAMMNACSEYVQLAQSQGRKWVRMLQHEHEQCLRLQEMVEQLAKQHSHLERAAKEASQPSQHNSSSAHSDEDEFFDAPEHSAADFVVSIPNKGHRRTASGLSLASEGGVSQNAASDTDSEQETGQETGVIRRRTATAVHAAPREGGDPPGDPVVRRERRTRVPEKPNCSLSLWSIMKNCIGKELTKIPMPVNFNEPLSTLQRLTEDYEYSELLDRAAKCNDPAVQLVYIAAFAVSSYATTSNRTGKPFNPLLGETYECDRRDDLGWRSLSEQVRPPRYGGFHVSPMTASSSAVPQFPPNDVAACRDPGSGMAAEMETADNRFLLAAFGRTPWKTASLESRALASQVSHHPPMLAQYCEGRGWRCWQEFSMSSKFRGKYLQARGTCESRCLESGVSTDPEPCGFVRPRLAVRGFPVSGEKGILVVEPSPGRIVFRKNVKVKENLSYADAKKRFSFLSKGGYAEVVRRGPAPRSETKATQVSPEILVADLRAPSPQQGQHAAPLGKDGPAIAVPALPFKKVTKGQQAPPPRGEGAPADSSGQDRPAPAAPVNTGRTPMEEKKRGPQPQSLERQPGTKELRGSHAASLSGNEVEQMDGVEPLPSTSTTLPPGSGRGRGSGPRGTDPPRPAGKFACGAQENTGTALSAPSSTPGSDQEEMEWQTTKKQKSKKPVTPPK
ncbi:hypothetical protein HPB47_016143 [Ixodes persulcatus]|uniref:Uncharacterized protein n=1 Tax=Ixodes persulcatus TaxID=34615 RepID=A0AC60QU68_IXOPE|nr:hypothetical protein HPB47_016143 [Ixodes persulcatus]